MDAKYRALWLLAGGEVPNHWVFCSIESLLESPKSISVGVMYPGKNNEGGVPLVRVSDVKNGKISVKPEFCVSATVDDEYKRTRLNGTELLITLVGNPGDCVVVSDQMAGWNVARALAVLSLKDVELRAWLRCILLSHPAKHQIDSRLNTTVQKTLNLKDIREIGIPLPPLKERKSITRCIGVIEEKIELNRQMNETLESMAQALFKSWFVDFDPVIDNALAAGNTIPDVFAQRAEQRKAQIAARKAAKKPENNHQSLFPSEFEFTEEMGWIPKGWEVSSLLDRIELIGGGTPKTTIEEYWNGNISWFSVVDAPSTADVFVTDTEKHVTELGVEKSSTKILRTGTTIISARGTVGKCAMVGKPMAMNQSCYGVNGKDGISDTFVYYSVLVSVSALQQRGHGSVFNTITRDTFDSIKIAFSGQNLTLEFDEVVKPYFDKILSNSFERKTLSKLRDTLLPKLLSGELRIPDAEKLIKEAGA